MQRSDLEVLKKISARWRHIARCKFLSADEYHREEYVRRFIENVAFCYLDCALELEKEIEKLDAGDEKEESAKLAGAVDSAIRDMQKMAAGYEDVVNEFSRDYEEIRRRNVKKNPSTS